MPHSTPSWEEFVAGWQLDLYRDPIYCGVLAGLLLGYLGVFVVLRRTVFITAAVSQAAGLGVALSFFAQIHLAREVPPVLGAVVLALALTFVLSLPLERLPIAREAVLGVAYLCTWMASIMVGAKISQESHDIASILYGSAVLVRPEDLHALAGVGALTLGTYLWGQRGLSFAMFDPEGARVQGLPVRALETVAWVLIALAVSVATRALGVLPVFAFAVLPAVTGLLLFRRLRWALWSASLLGAASGGGGYVLAFFLELPVGACQTAVAAGGFVLALPCALLLRRGLRS